MLHVWNRCLALIGILGLVGCATGSKSAHSGASQRAGAKSVYLEGVSALASTKAPSDRCLDSAAEFKGKTWKQLVRHANGCAKVGDWKKLDLAAQELAKVEINSPWGAYFHSLSAENSGDLPRALWMIELAMKKAPGAGLFHFQKGRILWRLDNFKDGFDEIRTATLREPKLIDAQIFLAGIYHRDQDLEKAATHYQAVIALDSRHRASLEGLADVFVAQGKYGKAVERLTDAISVSSSDLRLRIKLALAHEAIEGNHEQALASYRIARELQGRGSKGESLGVDVVDKIKSLEAKLSDAKSKQARLQSSSESLAAPRGPAEKPGGEK